MKKRVPINLKTFIFRSGDVNDCSLSAVLAMPVSRCHLTPL